MSLKSSKSSVNTVFIPQKDNLKAALIKLSDVIDNGIEKILESKINKHYKIDNDAKVEVRDIFIDLFCGFISPKIPASIGDCELRLNQWKKVNDKLKPSNEDRDIIRNMAVKGKKSKLCINFEKLINGIKSCYNKIESNVIIFICATIENIIQSYFRVCFEYQIRTKNGSEDILVVNTVKIIFSKYNVIEDFHNLQIYDTLTKLTQPFVAYKDKSSEFVPFLKDCREQLEVILKLFYTPLSVDDEARMVFGNLEDVFNDIGFIIDTLDDTSNIMTNNMGIYNTGGGASGLGYNDNNNNNKPLLGSGLMELVSMDMFKSFETYAITVIKPDLYRNVIESLLEKNEIVRQLISHYNSVIATIFGKSSSKRRGELMSKYHLLHTCDVCMNPITVSISDQSSSFSSSSSSISRASPQILLEDTLPIITTSPSPSPTPSTTGDSNKPRVPSNISCNLLVNCCRYLLPRLLTYPLFQLLYIHHILLEMSQFSSANSINPTALSDDKEERQFLHHTVQVTRHYSQTCGLLLQRLPKLQADFGKCTASLRTSESLRFTTRQSNQKLDELLSCVKKESECDQFRQLRGSVSFIIEGAAQVQQVNVSGSTSSSICSSGSNGPITDRYLYLFSTILLVCKRTNKKVAGSSVAVGTSNTMGQNYSSNMTYNLSSASTSQSSSSALPSSSSANSGSGKEMKLKLKICLDQFWLEDVTGAYINMMNNNSNNNNNQKGNSEQHAFVLHYRVPSSSSSSNNNSSSTNSSSVGGAGGSGNSGANNTSTHHVSTKISDQLSQWRTTHGSTNLLRYHDSFSSLNSRSISSSNQTITSNNTLTEQDSIYSMGNSICSNINNNNANMNEEHYKHTLNLSTLSLLVICSNYDEKCDWMSSLLTIQTNRLFSQFVLLKSHEEIPLRLPDPQDYKFAEPDSPTNIVYEPSHNDNSSDIPVVRAATLLKLITHVTHHTFSDTKTLHHFLLIYRQFAKSEDVLQLLIDRFHVPDPTLTDDEMKGVSNVATPNRIIKRFITGYKRKVQLRVVNFLAKWTGCSHHRYYERDFMCNPDLISNLQSFLDTAVELPHLAQKVRAILAQIGHRPSRESGSISQRTKPPPPIKEFFCVTSEDVSILNVHPMELARQISIIEWRLYSQIEFWEIHGRDTTHNEPNFSKMCDFSNRILYWLIYEIVKLRNIQDRVCAIYRVMDLMEIFETMNNLQGVQECKAAIISTAVYRLKDTFKLVCKVKQYRVIYERIRMELCDDSDDLISQTNSAPPPVDPSQFNIGGSTSSRRSSNSTSNNDAAASGSGNVRDTDESYTAQYHRKVHSIMAPAVPYIAMGDRTKLIHMHLRHPSFITPIHRDDGGGEDNNNGGDDDDDDNNNKSPTLLINFAKFRQMAELIEHYLSFQKIPYNFIEVSVIQTFLHTLDPLSKLNTSDRYKFDDETYQMSLDIQPKSTANIDQSTQSIYQNQREMSETQILFANWLNNLSLSDKMSDAKQYETDIPDPPLRSTKPSHPPPPVPDRPRHVTYSQPVSSTPPPLPSPNINSRSSSTNSSSPPPLPIRSKFINNSHNAITQLTTSSILPLSNTTVKTPPPPLPVPLLPATLSSSSSPPPPQSISSPNPDILPPLPRKLNSSKLT